jgi:hypothetical protein
MLLYYKSVGRFAIYFCTEYIFVLYFYILLYIRLYYKSVGLFFVELEVYTS